MTEQEPEKDEKDQNSPRKKSNVAGVHELMRRLDRETRRVYQAVGVEPSSEKVTDVLRDALNAMWPQYLAAEIGRFLGLYEVDTGESGEEEEE